MQRRLRQRVDSSEKCPPSTGLPRALDAVLQRIFNTRQPLSLEELLAMAPFTNANLNRPVITKLHLDSDCKSALKKLKEKERGGGGGGGGGGGESTTLSEVAVEKAEKRKKSKKSKNDAKESESELIDVAPAQPYTPEPSFDGLGSADGPARQAVNLSLLFMLVTGLSAISHVLVAIDDVAATLYGGATQYELDWCWLLSPLAQALFAPVAAYFIELHGLRSSVVAASVLHLAAAALRCVCVSLAFNGNSGGAGGGRAVEGRAVTVQTPRGGGTGRERRAEGVRGGCGWRC